MIIGILYKIILILVTIKAYILGRKQGFAAQNFIFLYLIISTVNDLSSFVRDLINSNVNVGLQYNFYFIFMIIFFRFYYSNIFIKKIKKNSLAVFIIVLIYISCFTKFLGEDFDSKLGIVGALFFIINTLLWFYQKLNSYDDEKITEDPHFWISSGLLLWSVFFIFRVAPMYLFNDIDKGFLQVLKIVLNIINIIMYSLFYVALTKFEKNNLKI